MSSSDKKYSVERGKEIERQLAEQSEADDRATERMIYNNKINVLIEDAQSRTNPMAARSLMAHYCQCIERSQQPPAALLMWVAANFADTLNGMSYEQASGLKVKRGGASKKLVRDHDMYFRASMLIRGGASRVEAIETVAAESFITVRAVEKAIAPLVNKIRHLNDIVPD